MVKTGAAAAPAAASVLILCFIFILYFGFSFDLISIFAFFVANTGTILGEQPLWQKSQISSVGNGNCNENESENKEMSESKTKATLAQVASVFTIFRDS